ncbi:MAG TPA: PilZ domain-containing protein, partial [Geobacteraceae bacterium]|nr:PilZ domain-containing protein [Geobacteraceae bacterium]
MHKDEPRQSARVSKLFLTSYVNLDEKGQITPVSVGRTLNVSRTGAGMEVFQEIEAGSLMDLEFDIQGSLLKVKGRVVHVRPEDDGCYVVGVEFEEPQEMLAPLP